MKNSIISVVVFVVVAAGVRLAIKGASYQNAENKVSNGQTYQAPVDFKAEMVGGCVGSGGEVNRTYCQCTVNYMANHLGEAKLQALALEYVKTNVTPPEMTEAVTACIDKYVEIENS